MPDYQGKRVNIFALSEAQRVWHSIPYATLARTLAATYYAPARYDAEGRDDKSYKQTGINAIVRATEEPAFYHHWESFLKLLQHDPQRETIIISALLKSRMAINMAGSILENAGISLEFVCGTPVIPGSAIKGAARRYAIALLEETPDDQKEELLARIIRVFGCSEADFEALSAHSDFAYGLNAQDSPTIRSTRMDRLKKEYSSVGLNRTGCVQFLQAVPKLKASLCTEILTPHHTKYYTGDFKYHPTAYDDEQAVPSVFPAVDCSRLTIYDFPITTACNSECNMEALLDAEEWLKAALTSFGIGAKGAAGYGFFELLPEELSTLNNSELCGTLTLQQADKETREKYWRKFADNWEGGKELEQGICTALLRSGDLTPYQMLLQSTPTQKQEKRRLKRTLDAIHQCADAAGISLPTQPSTVN